MNSSTRTHTHPSIQLSSYPSIHPFCHASHAHQMTSNFHFPFPLPMWKCKTRSSLNMLETNTMSDNWLDPLEATSKTKKKRLEENTKRRRHTSNCQFEFDNSRYHDDDDDDDGPHSIQCDEVFLTAHCTHYMAWHLNGGQVAKIEMFTKLVSKSALNLSNWQWKKTNEIIHISSAILRRPHREFRWKQFLPKQPKTTTHRKKFIHPPPHQNAGQKDTAKTCTFTEGEM